VWYTYGNRLLRSGLRLQQTPERALWRRIYFGLKLMKSLYLLLAAVLLLAQAPAMALTLIRVAAQESAEPKFIANTGNNPIRIGGICIDIMRAIEKNNNTIQFVGDQMWQPRARIDAGINAGTIDAICGVQRTKARESRYNFVTPALFSLSYLLAVRADDDIDVSSWGDIRKLNKDGIILVQHGFGIVDILEKAGGLTIDSGATSSLANLKKLIAGRGRFYCHRSPGIKSQIKDAGLESKVKLLPKFKFEENFYMALSKTVSDADAKKISAAILALESSGELKRLFEQYQE
jgi:polar amino acid transport system substrate-binding protein